MSEKTKSPLKLMIEGIIEEAIVASTHINKIVSGVTLMALETKKIAETILILNDRINTHEDLILRLAQAQRKDPGESIDTMTKVKQKPSKPN